MKINISWPDSCLIPHAKGHWRPKAAATKAARKEAHILTEMAINKGGKPVGEQFIIAVVANPPDRRRRDAFNVLASLKASLDGVADAMGVDDVNFLPGAFVWGEVGKPGSVSLIVEGVE